MTDKAEPLAVYDGREHIGTITPNKRGGFMAALANGDAVGIFTKQNDAARAISDSWRRRKGGQR